VSGATLRLYYANPSRAIRPRWLLEEIGTPYELVRVDLDAGEQKRPEYLALNPNGTVPTLVDGDVTLYESAAICQYLADKHPEFAPPMGTRERALYYQWMHYSMTSVDHQVITILHHTTYRPEHERIPALVTECGAQLAAAVAIIDAALDGKEYIVGGAFSAADVMIGSGVVWAQRLGMVAPEREAARAYADRLIQRPAFRRAIAD
jgi:glutathione S-transferase